MPRAANPGDDGDADAARTGALLRDEGRLRSGLGPGRARTIVDRSNYLRRASAVRTAKGSQRAHRVCARGTLRAGPPRHFANRNFRWQQQVTPRLPGDEFASPALDPAHPWRWFGRETRKTGVATYRYVVVSSRIRRRLRRGRRTRGTRPAGDSPRGHRSRRTGLFGDLFGPELLEQRIEYVTASAASYNGALGTGASTTFGFQGTYSTSDAAPATVTCTPSSTVTPAIVTTTASAPVMQGFTDAFGVALSAPPTANVTVAVGRSRATPAPR